MQSEYCGKIIRRLIADHHKGRPTPKQEIGSDLSLSNQKLASILEETQSYLRAFELEIAGVSPSAPVYFEFSDKVFLRRILSTDDELTDSKKFKPSVVDDDRLLFFILVAIQIENNSLAESKLDVIGSCRYFSQVSVLDTMKRLKGQGYLSCKRDDEETTWSYGWRYYVEFEDSFNFIGFCKRDA